VCVPGLHAAKVQRCAVGGGIGDGALLPVLAAVGGFQHNPAGAAGPGYRSVDVVDAAQAGGGAGILHLPDWLRLGLTLHRRGGWGLGCGMGCEGDEQSEPDGLHGWQYSVAAWPSHPFRVREKDRHPQEHSPSAPWLPTHQAKCA